MTFMEQITYNFNISEFIESDTALKHMIDNTPDEEAKKNIRLLVKNLLQPLRSLYRKPIYINSGYRCHRLNELVGGVPTSQHCKGQAADCRCLDPKKLLNILIGSGLDFDQAILYPTFLHLSYDPDRNRQMIIRK